MCPNSSLNSVLVPCPLFTTVLTLPSSLSPAIHQNLVTPDAYHATSLRTLSKALSKSRKAQNGALFISKNFSHICLIEITTSVVHLPGINPNSSSPVFTFPLSLLSRTLSLPVLILSSLCMQAHGYLAHHSSPHCGSLSACQLSERTSANKLEVAFFKQFKPHIQIMSFSWQINIISTLVYESSLSVMKNRQSISEKAKQLARGNNSGYIATDVHTR